MLFANNRLLPDTHINDISLMVNGRRALALAMRPFIQWRAGFRLTVIQNTLSLDQAILGGQGFIQERFRPV